MAPTQTEEETEGGEYELLAAILTELQAIRDVIEETN